MTRHNIRYIRPVEAFERYEEPELDCTVWEAVGMLIVTAVGTGMVLVIVALVML